MEILFCFRKRVIKKQKLQTKKIGMDSGSRVVGMQEVPLLNKKSHSVKTKQDLSGVGEY